MTNTDINQNAVFRILNKIPIFLCASPLLISNSNNNYFKRLSQFYKRRKKFCVLLLEVTFFRCLNVPTFRHSTLDAFCDALHQICYSYNATRKWKSCNALIHNHITPYVMTQFTQPQNKLFMDRQQFA